MVEPGRQEILLQQVSDADIKQYQGQGGGSCPEPEPIFTDAEFASLFPGGGGGSSDVGKNGGGGDDEKVFKVPLATKPISTVKQGLSSGGGGKLETSTTTPQPKPNRRIGNPEMTEKILIRLAISGGCNLDGNLVLPSDNSDSELKASKFIHWALGTNKKIPFLSDFVEQLFKAGVNPEWISNENVKGPLVERAIQGGKGGMDKSKQKKKRVTKKVVPPQPALMVTSPPPPPRPKKSGKTKKKQQQQQKDEQYEELRKKMKRMLESSSSSSSSSSETEEGKQKKIKKGEEPEKKKRKIVKEKTEEKKTPKKQKQWIEVN